ncbi:MAG: FCD domain-containing protein [Filomicrobium sp.]
MTEIKTVFEPIEIPTVSDAVVAQIEDLVLTGVLKSGQKLPPERELAELLDVSRPMVREALKVLESRHLIVARQGEGTFVAELTGAALSPAMIELFAQRPKAFEDYLEFRFEVEGYAAFLAAQRATEGDREIIKRIIGEMEEAHELDDPTREALADVLFHTSIVDAAHNAMLVHVMSSIYELMRRGVFYNRNFLYERSGGRDALLSQHLAIANAVIAGDPEKACEAAEAHMAYVQSAFDVGREDQKRARTASKRLLLMGSGSGLSGKPVKRLIK